MFIMFNAYKFRCRLALGFEGLQLFSDSINYQYVSAPIHTYCIGQAASMGSLLLSAGEKGKRHCLPNASIMIHRTQIHDIPSVFGSHPL